MLLNVQLSFVIMVVFLPLYVLSDVSKAKQKQQKKKQQTPSSATAMKLVSTNRQGVTKQVKRLQGRLGAGKSKATVKDKRIKSAVGQCARSPAHHRCSQHITSFTRAVSEAFYL